ncbi:MAG: alanine racemase [Hyphomicrobiales bacterium]
MERLQTPTLIIDKEKCINNIKRMYEKAINNNISFRPHFKTHQSAIVGDWFKEMGINQITVSSVDMAIYFADNRWEDITIAFPANIHQYQEINQLSQRITLNIILDHIDTASVLSERITTKTGVFIEIDIDYHRSGICYTNLDYINKLLNIIEDSNYLEFKGFLTHTGNTYSAENKGEIISIMNKASQVFESLRKNYIQRFPDLITSYGDTPSCSIADSFQEFDELRPGNFIYYDFMQQQLEACELEEIAVSVACPVVGKYPERNEIIIYGGAVHFSKENLYLDDAISYGYPYKIISHQNDNEECLTHANLKALSQEHGTIRLSIEDMNKVNIGDIIFIYPIHSCLTADLIKDIMIIE